MTAVRVCTDCGHESDLMEAATYCCGSRSIRCEWRCDDCGAVAEQGADGWSVDGKRRVCGECAPAVAKAKRVRRVKTKKAETPEGGLF